MIGHSNVMRPKIELPLQQAQYPAQHRSAVDAYPHVQVHLQTIPPGQVSTSLRYYGMNF